MSQASFVGYGITGAVAALGVYVMITQGDLALGAALVGGSILVTVVLSRYHLRRAKEEGQGEKR